METLRYLNQIENVATLNNKGKTVPVNIGGNALDRTPTASTLHETKLCPSDWET
jgi:hypothetical protein